MKWEVRVQNFAWDCMMVSMLDCVMELLRKIIRERPMSESQKSSLVDALMLIDTVRGEEKQARDGHWNFIDRYKGEG